MKLDSNQKVFLSLVRAGLWEQDVQLLQFGKINFKEIYRRAQTQSVVGLVAAGIEHITDIKAPQFFALQIVGDTIHIEQQNV